MHIETLEKRANEKEPVARLSSNEDDGLNDQELSDFCVAALKSWTGASPY